MLRIAIINHACKSRPNKLEKQPILVCLIHAQPVNALVPDGFQLQRGVATVDLGRARTGGGVQRHRKQLQVSLVV